MQPRVAVLLAAFLALAAPVLAQTASVRRQVSTARVLSVTTTCFYGPNLDEPQAVRLCRQQARSQLLDAAVAQFGREPVLARSALPTRERRAFVDSLLVVTPLTEETRQVADGQAVRLTLRAEENPGKLADKLASFRADGRLQAEAVAATARRDRQAAEARMAAVPFSGEQDFDAPPGPDVLSAATALASHRLVPGMSVASVKGLIGNPASLRQSVISHDSYLCAGYDNLWVVFRDGVVACLRTRLVYDPRLDTDCHCAGNYATILNTD